DLIERAPGGAHLGLADRVERGEDLAIQIRDLEAVDVREREAADAGAGQHLHRRAAHAANAADEHGAHAQPLLFFRRHEACVAAGELGVAERGGWACGGALYRGAAPMAGAHRLLPAEGRTSPMGRSVANHCSAGATNDSSVMNRNRITSAAGDRIEAERMK